jgi:hypothetical protein
MYRSHAGDMGPINLVVGHRQELGLRPLLHWLVWERSWVRTRGSVSRRAMHCVGSPFFSGAVESIQICRRLVKGCHVQGLPQEAYVGHTWTGLGSIHVMLVGFPLQGVSIRITTTLGYE